MSLEETCAYKLCFVIPQLSQDLIPVVYHDFELLASIVNKKGDRQMMVQMPLKNLTLEQLQQLKVYSFFSVSYGFADFSKAIVKL